MTPAPQASDSGPGGIADPRLITGVVSQAHRTYCWWLIGYGVMCLVVMLLQIPLSLKVGLGVLVTIVLVTSIALMLWRARNIKLLGSTAGISALWGTTVGSFIAVAVAVGNVWLDRTWWWVLWGVVLLLCCVLAGFGVRRSRSTLAEPKGVVR